MALPVDLVVFDLMGTVVKDVGVMEEALTRVLTMYGIPFSHADQRAMRGAGKRSAFAEILQRTFGAEKDADWCRARAEEMYSTFKSLLREGYSGRATEEIPGSTATIGWLRERGAKVAATSALDVDLALPLLERLGWAEGVFDCLVSTEEVPEGRPAPYMIFAAMMRTGTRDVRRVAVVGDTALDLLAGANAGVGWIIGVLSGVGTLETLGMTRHTHILGSVAGLPQLWPA